MSRQIPIARDQDVRGIRMWLNKLESRCARLETKLRDIARRGKQSTNTMTVAPMIAVVLADTDLIDIYRGEGDNEKKIAENVDYKLRSDFEVVEGQRLLALNIRGVWECYVILDGLTNFGEGVHVHYVAAMSVDPETEEKTIGWKEVTRECEEGV